MFWIFYLFLFIKRNYFGKEEFYLVDECVFILKETNTESENIVHCCNKLDLFVLFFEIS